MKRTRFFLLILTLSLLIGLLSGCDGSGSNDDAAAIIRYARNGVVRVLAINYSNGRIVSGGTGTAFGVGTTGEDTDTFLTNWHVVTSDNVICDEVYLVLDSEAVWIEYQLDANTGEPVWTDFGFEKDFDTKVVRCEVVYATTDLDGFPDYAILRTVEPISGVKALPLLSSGAMKVLDTVYAIGYPGTSDVDGLKWEGSRENGHLLADIEDVVSTSGEIQRFTPLRWADNTKAIAHAAHINHGNSGGPLLNKDGAVVGINTYGSVSGDDFINYSIYIDYAMDKMDELDIRYDVYDPSTGKPSPNWLVPIIAVAVVLILLAAVFLAARRRKAAVPTSGGSAAHPDNGGAVVSPAEAVVQITLRATGGELRDRLWPVSDTVTIGRDRSCAVLFSPTAKGVSRQHCRVAVSGGGIALTDLNSTYGTFVGGQRLSPGGTAQLKKGDQFYLGDPQNNFVIQ